MFRFNATDLRTTFLVGTIVQISPAVVSLTVGGIATNITEELLDSRFRLLHGAVCAGLSGFNGVKTAVGYALQKTLMNELKFNRIHIVWTLAIVFDICCFGCSKSNKTVGQLQFVASAPAPASPQWLKEVPAVPDWWTNVTVSYDEQASISEKWSHVRVAESNILMMVRAGYVPTKERRELVKYLTAFSESRFPFPQTRSNIDFEIALRYEELGDYKWAARIYADLAKNSPDGETLYQLALEYERLDDLASARELYYYMASSFGTNSFGREFGLRGIACLAGTNCSCALTKPDWWARYQSLPDWYSEERIELPQFTSWADGWEFFSSGIRKQGDKRATLKAAMLLSKFSPMTFNEKEMSLLLLGRAYLDLGDHHRAIEAYWQIPEKFPRDPMDTIIALGFIASEFNKLGDSTNAAIIKDDLSCFRSAAINAGLTPWRSPTETSR